MAPLAFLPSTRSTRSRCVSTSDVHLTTAACSTLAARAACCHADGPLRHIPRDVVQLDSKRGCSGAELGGGRPRCECGCCRCCGFRLRPLHCFYPVLGPRFARSCGGGWLRLSADPLGSQTILLFTDPPTHPPASPCKRTACQPATHWRSHGACGHLCLGCRHPGPSPSGPAT